MARDRFDDEDPRDDDYEDRPGSGRFRDADDDDDDDDGYDRHRRGHLAVAKSKVKAPAIIMMLFGLLGLTLGVATLALAFMNPTWAGNAYANAFEPMIKGQPPSREKENQLKRIEEMRNMRMDSPFNLASTALSLVASLLVAIGGMKMKDLKSYGLSLTAAIVSLYPCGSCMCCLMPFGIWALIVLMSGDVKSAFRANARL